MELIRFKSKNLNGRLSGCLKDRIVCLRTIIRSLVDRAKDSGDLPYLRRRNDELAAQLRESKKEEIRLQSSLRESDLKNEKLNSEIQALRRRIGSKSSSMEPIGSVSLAKDKQDTPRRTPRKEPSVKKDIRREPSIVESLQDCDERLRAISKCDEKIAKFEEMLKQMRSDLYGSIEAIEDKVTRTVNVADPPKRGVPRIISNIQLVPPRSTTRQEPESNPQQDDPVFSDFDTWTEVTSRRNRKKRVRIEADRAEDPPELGPTAENLIGRPPPPPPSGGVRRRAPRKAAVAIKANPDGMSYADIMKKAREKINLSELGINNFAPGSQWQYTNRDSGTRGTY